MWQHLALHVERTLMLLVAIMSHSIFMGDVVETVKICRVKV